MNFEFFNKIFEIRNQDEFNASALEIFNYQANNNKVYREFLEGLRKEAGKIKDIHSIPFLPVEFFRSRKVIADDLDPGVVFESSGTTGSVQARHYVHDVSLYETSFLKSFTAFYGDPSGWLITALLPSYTERGNSSLVYMTDKLIMKSSHPGSGFYRDNKEELISVMRTALSSSYKVILLGVSFALLDLAEKYSPDLSGAVVMETGGMKGRRREMTREELHSVLKEKLNVPVIHSEYGMTELLSQAWSKGNGIYYSPPWMKILIRDPHDPLYLIDEPGRTGAINIIDLANIYSCSFLATSDLGKLHEDGGFEVLGRFDNSDIRGCNLMAV